MHDMNGSDERGGFGTMEGLALAVSYLSDPSAVECPRCGEGSIQVVAYLDAQALHEGRQVECPPDGDYAVVLYCRSCEQGAALSFEASADDNRRAA